MTTYSGDFVCNVCGGKNIECKAWVDANSGAFVSWDTGDDEGDAWCNDCEGHVRLVEEVCE